jgi:hypothetical protein
MQKTLGLYPIEANEVYGANPQKKMLKYNKGEQNGCIQM